MGLNAMTEDTELLRAYAENRSEAAFTELVKRHLGLVYRVALRKVGGDTHLAEDVAQNVFTALARKAGVLSRREVLTGWLFTSTHFAATKAVRTEQRRRDREQRAQTMNEFSSDSATATDWERLRPMLDDLIHELPEVDREAVLLRFFEERHFEQVGLMLNLSPTGARSRVERALEKIRVSLAGRGITTTAAALATALEAPSLLAVPAGLAATVSSAAIAGAAGGSTALFAGFLMNKTLIAGAVAIIAIGFALYQLKQTSRTEAAFAEISRERDGLQMQLHAEQRRATEAEGRAAGLKRDFDHLFSDKKSSAAPVSAAGFTTGPAMPAQGEGQWFFVKSPSDPVEARRQLRAFNGAAIDATYAALYRKLGLSPAQQEQFKALKLDNMESSSALFKAAAAKSPSHDRSTMQTMAEVINDQGAVELQASMRGAFGDGTAQAIEHYQSTLPARNVANQLASALFYSENPLTVMQAEQLVEIVADAARAPQGKVDLSAMNSEGMLAQAQSVLSEAQFAALRQLEFQRLFRQPAK